MPDTQNTTKRKIELLAPARTTDIAIDAINHGADAIYIGASSHGARQSATNSIDDIRRLTEYAHKFHVKVYSTVNTIVYDHELKDVERLIRELYLAEVDAIIVQDMGILRLDIPPIQLHASTQCDTRTIEKARFLENVGCSQIVLARELSIEEIAKICKFVTVPIETFIHGALCVSYSGRCHASQISQGRSANRGECAQLCRLPYTLRDATGKVIIKDKHLLSLRDFNASSVLADMLSAGVSSFKIEGRLKDSEYVRNVVAYYRQIIDEEIKLHPDLYERASKGLSNITFTPNPQKSFNRGFTHYFLKERKPHSIASIHTPKSLGELLIDTKNINNGDGISFFDKNGEYTGFRVNKVINGKLFPAQKVSIPKGAQLYRTYDQVWENEMSKQTATRKIAVDISIDEIGISAIDERGNKVRIKYDAVKDCAKKPFNPRTVFEKLGNTIYYLRSFENNLYSHTFIPISQLTIARRELIDQLELLNRNNYKYNYRRKEINVEFPYPYINYQDNVSNKLANQFYTEHGVKTIELAIETTKQIQRKSLIAMTCRHCILREIGNCKQIVGKTFIEPLTISSGNTIFELKFDCKNCEMLVIAPNK